MLMYYRFDLLLILIRCNKYLSKGHTTACKGYIPIISWRLTVSYGAKRYSGSYGDRGVVKGNGKNKNRNTNNRTNKINQSTESVPKSKWEEDRQARAKALHIQPKNPNQNLFLKSLKNNVISIGTGSAGTGKTYLACKYAASELLAGNIRKIAITRPYVAVSGRTTGFKPDTDLEKLRPFIQPMLNVLYEVLGKGMVEEQLLLADKIELVPFESIRGRSFDDCIIIVDEGSNTTIGELQAITTRLGENCRLVIIGDNAQSDTSDNGLRWFEGIVIKHGIPDIGITRFTSDDIVRSPMVKALVMAFEAEGGYQS